MRVHRVRARTIAILFGAVAVFGGYRLFLFLLPIWGFFAGFLLGAQTIHYLFDVGLFAAVSLTILLLTRKHAIRNYTIDQDTNSKVLSVKRSLIQY